LSVDFGVALMNVKQPMNGILWKGQRRAVRKRVVIIAEIIRHSFLIAASVAMRPYYLRNNLTAKIARRELGFVQLELAGCGTNFKATPFMQ
jgi:hypothetical protein